MIDPGIPPSGLSQFAGPVYWQLAGPTAGFSLLIPSRANRCLLILACSTGTFNLKPGGIVSTATSVVPLMNTLPSIILTWNDHGPACIADWYGSSGGASQVTACEWWYNGSIDQQRVVPQAGLITDGTLARLLAKLNPFKRT